MVLLFALTVFAAGCSQQGNESNSPPQTPTTSGSTADSGGTTVNPAGGMQSTLDQKLAECQKFSVKTETESCISVAAETEKNGQACSGIETVNVRDDCYGNVAGILKDQELCGRIVTDTIRNACYGNIAVELLDPGVCEKIENALAAKDQCYYEIANAKNDKALCEKIYGDYLKKKCQTGA
ncbi:MAG: hypothetical protein HY394_03130 [Candidatus Diapherotrites archaeon]|nr:hypothetical protein [Candidatus Diapherotrites archaeon]